MDGIADAPAWINSDFKFENLNVFWTTVPPEAPGSDKMHIGLISKDQRYPDM